MLTVTYYIAVTLLLDVYWDITINARRIIKLRSY